MKRIIAAGILAAILTLLLSGVAFAQTFYPKQVDFCDEYVTMRSGASTSAAEICKVYIGEVVMAADYNSKFDYCCYNGHYGYILRNYLDTEIMPWSEGRFCIANCNEWVSLRPMPDDSIEARAQIPLGAVLDQIYYHDDEWIPENFAYVLYNGQFGFVKWRYLDYIDYGFGAQ